VKIPEVYREVDVREFSLTDGDVFFRRHLCSKAFFIYRTRKKTLTAKARRTQRILRTMKEVDRLSKKELENWRCQFVTSNSTDKMGLRYPPYAFTEQGVFCLLPIIYLFSAPPR
jgi:hypothetical protein